jgi:hypothetical protein
MSENKIEEPVDDDGLTEHEREYLTTPLSKLTPDQRMNAVMIREKRDNKRWADNAAAREAEKKANALAA